MTYFGDNKKGWEYDMLTACHVDAHLFSDEASLYGAKWWDYRFLHPMQATYLFADCYKKAIKNALRVRSDLYRAANFKGLKSEDFLETSKTTITGMWKARREADAHGVPYDFWCIYSMRFAEDRDWRYLPKPNQLYGTKAHEKARDGLSMKGFILDKWAEANANQCRFAESFYYKTQSFVGHPYQQAHMKWVVDRLEIGGNKPPAIASFVLNDQLAFPELLERKYGEKGRSLLRQAAKFV